MNYYILQNFLDCLTKSQVVVIWMMVILIAQVQYEYDFVHVVCTCVTVCVALTEVLWMTATACFWCVCIPPSCCA